MKKNKNEIWYKQNTIYFGFIVFFIPLISLIILSISFLFINFSRNHRFDIAIFGIAFTIIGIFFSISVIKKFLNTEIIRITKDKIQIISNKKIVNQICWTEIKNIYYSITPTNTRIFYFDDGSNKPINKNSSSSEYMLRLIIDHKVNEFFDIIKMYTLVVPIEKTFI